MHAHTHVRTYVRTSKHTYIHTCIHTYLHFYKCTYIRTCIHTNTHARLHTCAHKLQPTNLHAGVHSYSAPVVFLDRILHRLFSLAAALRSLSGRNAARSAADSASGRLPFRVSVCRALRRLSFPSCLSCLSFPSCLSYLSCLSCLSFALFLSAVLWGIGWVRCGAVRCVLMVCDLRRSGLSHLPSDAVDQVLTQFQSVVGDVSTFPSFSYPRHLFSLLHFSPLSLTSTSSLSPLSRSSVSVSLSAFSHCYATRRVTSMRVP